MIRPRRLVPAATRRIGVEHEYEVRDRDGVVDARRLWPTLPFDGARLDPGDANAVRCRWGGVLTTDGREAEAATPPRRLAGSGVLETAQLADAGAGALLAALPPGMSVRGYSTHLNVEVADRRAPAIARAIVQRTAPAVMLLLDRADSPGLLVRPRHCRLELAGEFQRGDALVAALVLAAGTVLATEAALERRRRRALPPRLELRSLAAPQRYGWYVDRRAGGEDLYEHGRATRLVAASGEPLTAQVILERTWDVARPYVDGVVAPAAVALVDAAVRGERPVPCEAPAPGDPPPTARGPAGPAVPASVLDVRRRGAVTLTAATATWHALVLRASAGGRTRWIRVPGERADAFLAAVDGGELDGWLASLFQPARRLGAP